MEENKETPAEQQNKTRKSFESNLELVGAVLGKPLSKTGRRKTKDSDLDELTADLFKEEDDAIKAEVKAELKGLAKKYIELNEQMKAKQKELEKLEEEKMKEFNQAAEKLRNKIEILPERMRKFKDSLRAVSGATSTPAVEPPAV